MPERKVLTLSYLGGEGALSARVLGDKSSLLDFFTYCTETFWLFLNLEKNGQNLNSNFYPNPPSEGVSKKLKIFKIGHRSYVAKHDL